MGGKRRQSYDVMIQQTQNSISAVLDLQKHPPEVRDALAFISTGGTLTKVRSKKKQHQRFFKVENGGSTPLLVYTDSKKKKYQSKSNDQSHVYVHKIEEIREGPASDVFLEAFRDSTSPPEASCCFTIAIHGERTLDLVAPDSQTRTLWITGLNHMVKMLEEADTATTRNLFLRENFCKADSNNSGSLDLKEILKLLETLNINVDKDYAKFFLQDAEEHIAKQQSGAATKGKNKSDEALTLEEFVVFCDLITKRNELDEIFRRYDHGSGHLTVNDLSVFWKTEQQEDLKPDEIKKIIETCEACPKLKEKSLLSLSGFYVMVKSEWMNIKDRKCQTVYQDMNQPLCNYFIDSSHNTYLAEDQLTGPSKVECYMEALRRGCRCVELDVWDGKDGLPVIYHGHTLTSKISFRDVIKAINETAFETSKFPVILSIENHCSIDQQKRMAEDMKAFFGPKLFLDPLPQGTNCLPTPNQLKGKIVMKGKKLPDAAAEEDDISDEDEAADIDDEQVKEDVSKKKSKDSKQKLAKELSDCVIICQSVSFKSFQQAAETSTCKHISSFAERKAMDLVEEQCDDFVRHNMWQLSRIYPAGLRTDSSNYDPMPLWKAGCQIVALNYQTGDMPMHVNKALFEDNGRSGYVLKPEFLRSASNQYKSSGPYPSQWKRKLTIKVISGWQLPKKKNKSSSILDPFVKINIFGVPSDSQEKQTDVINNNGFHPCWNRILQFAVNCPDLALILFRVYDEEDHKKDIVVAQYGLRMNSLKPGFRTINLKMIEGEPLNVASLFVHVAIEAL